MTEGSAPRSSPRRRPRRLYFAAGALAPVAVIAVVLIATSGSDQHKVAPKSSPAPPLPQLSVPFAYRALGVAGSLPKGWTATSTGGSLVRLRSTDRSAVIAIGADRAAPTAAAALNPVLAAAQKSYRAPSVTRVHGGTLAGLPAQSAVFVGHNQQGVPIRILLASARGRKLTYLLEVFTAQRSPARRLVEAREILLALRLTG